MVAHVLKMMMAGRHPNADKRGQHQRCLVIGRIRFVVLKQYLRRRWALEYIKTINTALGNNDVSLGLGASKMEIKVHYRQLAHKYHPDKNDPTATGLNTTEASDFFKLLNNANEYLKEPQ
jgi:hypothetical protein